MQKVFLSHSSADKKSYVQIVSNRLIKDIGEEHIILDEITFQQGRKTLEEINRNLNETDLFVIFISEASLKSDWVKHEVFRAKELWDERKLLQICPVIISETITYDNPDIPNWLRENYNLQYISRPTKAAQIIEQRMIELSFERHPRLKERNEIFVGRNELIAQFEERIDDFEKCKPVCMVASGITSVGRKTLLRKCIYKSNIKKSSYPFPEITLNYADSIEDFIFKIYDLGFEPESKLDGLMTMSMEEKIAIAATFMATIQKQSDIVFIDDYGSVISQDGELAEWFWKMIAHEKMKEKFSICVISRYRLRSFAGNPSYLNKQKIVVFEVPELNKKERDGLLQRYLRFENIEIDIEDKRLISGLLTGLPEQVYYSVQLLKSKGLNYLRNNTNEIVAFSSKKANILLREIEKDKEQIAMLALLSLFDSVSFKFLLEIVDNDEKYIQMINGFISKSLCEYVGALKEYIRVNETIKDYVTRNNYSILDKHKTKMDENLKSFLSSMSMNEYDVPEFLFSLKLALSKGEKIDERHLVPSIYLKTMTELYNKRRNKEVILFAYKALEKEEYIDPRIAFELRYLLCSALAKLKDNRFNEEVHKITGANFYFLFGFYYRQIGKYANALEMLDKSMEKRANFSKAKREKVQVYISMQEFQAAKELARENYLNYMDNPYHIQAYFSCVIKSEKNMENKDILYGLIDSLKNINTDIAKEMTLRCQAQMEAIYEDDKEKAISMIDQAIACNSDIQYARIVKFDICDKLNMTDEMKVILEYFEQPEFRNKYYNNIVSFKSIIMAKEGNVVGARNYFMANIRDYTDGAKEKFASKLERYERE
ncbi:MAG: toll/interleukin-1 receptor domain-containing protein [Selenomonadaceae bacterium]|nr:toll/interleukin-1 receptor domain-containing protein [Selenomonadaceae bacterium]